MSLIKSITTVKKCPIKRTFSDSYSYLSPKNNIEAIFYDPFEFSMGAESWELKIIKDGNDIYPSLNVMSHLALEGFFKPDNYQPWSSDGNFLYLIDRSGRNMICDVSKKIINYIDISAIAITGSATIDRFLILTENDLLLTDNQGNINSKLSITYPKYEFPSVGWIKDTTLFYSIFHPSKTDPIQIHFYEGKNGEHVETSMLNPDELLPYNKDIYKEIDRDKYSLVISASRQCVGYLLDIWHGVNYDIQKNSIYCAVYRPTSPVYKSDEIMVCDVAEKWIKIDFGI